VDQQRSRGYLDARPHADGGQRTHSLVYAIWADGDARQPSRSVVHIATRDGDVFALPERISAGSALPTRLVGPDR
jgi:hypothetical protein